MSTEISTLESVQTELDLIEILKATVNRYLTNLLNQKAQSNSQADLAGSIDQLTQNRFLKSLNFHDHKLKNLNNHVLRLLLLTTQAKLW